MEDDDLKEYANSANFSHADNIGCQEEYDEASKRKEKCKLNEKEIVLDYYRARLGNALITIDALEDEITELQGERRGK